MFIWPRKERQNKNKTEKKILQANRIQTQTDTHTHTLMTIWEENENGTEIKLTINEIVIMRVSQRRQ